MQIDLEAAAKPIRFPIGRLLATTGVLAATGPDSYVRILEMLKRHMSCDWGAVDDDDKRQNDAALKNGERLISAYPIDPNKPCKGYGDNTVWVITERDRSATTFLLPEEY